MKNVLSKIITAIALFIVGIINAQFAIIQDKDGFVNVRKEGKKGNNIIDKLNNGTIVYALEPASLNWDWTTIIYNGEKKGVIALDRLHFVQDFPKLRIEETQNEIKLDNELFVVTIKTQKFLPKKNKLTYKNGAITQINGKNTWGNDGIIPQNEYQSIKIMQGNKEIILPTSEYKNLYNPDLSQTYAHYDKATKRL